MSDLSKLSKPTKKDAYYIASGFFNPEQIATVAKVEASLKGLNMKYFSPRDESIKFFEETNPEIKSMMTKLIFNNNLDSMDACNKFIVNLQDEDQGTLFEYGYIVGKKMMRTQKPVDLMARGIKIMNDRTNLEKKVLESLGVDDRKLIDFDFISKGKDFDFMMNLVSKKLNILTALNDYELIILSIDDRDPINMFLVGLYYSQEIPVITYSRKGYGTNVMLVHSTYHCETEAELIDLIEELNKDKYEVIDAERGTYLKRLRINKQTWNKQID